MLLVIIYVCRPGCDTKCISYLGLWSKKLENVCLDGETRYTFM